MKTTSTYDGGSNRLGLGVATVNVGTAGAQTLITGWIPLKSSSMGIQPYLGIFGTTGSFNFLAGAAFKATIAGGASTGLHIGGDVLLGSVASEFVGTFGGIFGFHYAFHPQVFLHVDAGPQVSVAAGTANFTLGGVSSLLGASLIYLF